VPLNEVELRRRFFRALARSGVGVRTAHRRAKELASFLVRRK
jgi:hypothetical protein